VNIKGDYSGWIQARYGFDRGYCVFM